MHTATSLSLYYYVGYMVLITQIFKKNYGEFECMGEDEGVSVLVKRDLEVDSEVAQPAVTITLGSLINNEWDNPPEVDNTLYSVAVRQATQTSINLHYYKQRSNERSQTPQERAQESIGFAYIKFIPVSDLTVQMKRAQESYGQRNFHVVSSVPQGIHEDGSYFSLYVRFKDTK
jgi:hypothetical protein